MKWIAVLVLSFAGGCWAANPMIDAHSHYTAGNALALAPEDIVVRLDAAGVARVVVSGSPWQHARELHAHAPERVIPLLGVYASHVGKAVWMHDR